MKKITVNLSFLRSKENLAFELDDKMADDVISEINYKNECLKQDKNKPKEQHTQFKAIDFP